VDESSAPFFPENQPYSLFPLAPAIRIHFHDRRRGESSYYCSALPGNRSIRIGFCYHYYLVRNQSGTLAAGNVSAVDIEELDRVCEQLTRDLVEKALPGAQAVVSEPDYVLIPKYSESIELAKNLLAFMLSKEGQQIRAHQGGKLLVRNDIPASNYPKADQEVAALVARMSTTVRDLDDSVAGDWQRLFWEQLKLLWAEPESLEEVLDRLEAGMPR
jgi:hypothetical protein